MTAVTSFSQQGYEIYGKKFLESAVDNYPGKIIVYYEEKPDFDHEKIEYRNLYDVYGLDAFLRYCETNPVFSGKLLSGYTFNFDAAKFSRKAFAQFDALERTEGKVFWIDADCVFKKPVPEQFLSDIFHGKTLSVLWREGLYTETGFVGFDTKGIGFEHFLNTYKSVYRTGKLFTLRGWHDCYAMDEAIRSSGVSFHNLSHDFPEKGINVMPYSEIGEYLIHNKGNRKFKESIDVKQKQVSN